MSLLLTLTSIQCPFSEDTMTSIFNGKLTEDSAQPITQALALSLWAKHGAHSSSFWRGKLYARSSDWLKMLS